jgi:glyoxylase-like metal-dependent hydrolase (beta-lactamase superfamily II)
VTVHAIDLEHHGIPGSIATYLLLDGEPTLVDPGPASTLPRLREALAAQGVPLGDLRHLLLTHVHLDHAGAAGDLAAAVPKLRVHVHRDAAPHLVDPEKLVASTRRTFGAAHDELWGVTRGVRADAITAWEPRGRLPAALRRLRALPTPGHIAHHLAYLDEGDGTVFAGDALGIVLHADAPSHTPTPPPAVDLDAWRATLAALRGLGAERAAIAHFGVHRDVAARTHRLQEALDRLEARVRKALAAGREEQDARAFEEEARDALGAAAGREWADRVFDVFRPENDWRGVRRWVETTSGSGKEGER